MSGEREANRATQQPVEVSVLVPMLNEERNIPRLMERVDATMEGSGLTWEMVAVLDGGTDGSLAVLLEHRKRFPLVVVDLAFRCGQHAALGQGLAHARGRYIVTIDADLQNPPEAIPDIVARLDADADAVGTIRRGRKDPFHRRVASRLFAATLKTLGARHVMSDPGCMLRGWRRHCVDAFLAQGEPAVYIPTQLNRFAARYEEFPTGHEERGAGTSHYGSWTLARLFARTAVAQVRPALVAGSRPVVKEVYGA